MKSQLKQSDVLLSSEKIGKNLSIKLREKIVLDIVEQLPSTNTYLLKNSEHDYSLPVFCLAEQQTAGKGRRGRQWHSPFAQNIYCSCRLDLNCDVSQLSGLSLVVGLAVVKAIEKFDAQLKPQLKWPNDILIDGKKCGGILIEVIARKNHTCSVVIGVGLNVNMQQADDDIDQPWTTLQQHHGKIIDRNLLVAALIEVLIDYLSEFESQGFVAFEKQWQRYDALLGKHITLHYRDETIMGKMLGVDRQGQLRLEKSDKTIITCNAGDTSLRSGVE